MRVEFKAEKRGYMLMLDQDLFGAFILYRQWWSLLNRRGGTKRQGFFRQGCRDPRVSSHSEDPIATRLCVGRLAVDRFAMMRRWFANVMTSGRQGVLVTHDRSTRGRLAPMVVACRTRNDALTVDCKTTGARAKTSLRAFNLTQKSCSLLDFLLIYLTNRQP